MSRQETTNTFTEGMIMDLNPLTTPETVLTDCLNGTIITYDGNEFILQNDKGNFKLRNARLNPNFIPVGIKEYADILYIVSYNPLTKETEVGSYPSPQRIFSTTDRDNVVEFTPIIPNGTTVDDTYENLTKDIKLQIYTNSSDNDSYILNPGDEFQLEVIKDLNFPYQEIQFAILSEDRELFEIEMPDEYINQFSFKKVFWEVPGWLTGKYRLANLDQFYLNIRTLNLPEFKTENTFTAGIVLNTQIEISDELLLSNPNVNTDLKVQLSIQIIDENGTVKSTNTVITDILNEYDYNNLSTTYFYNFDNFSTENGGLTNLQLSDTIFISAIPYLDVAGSIVWYEQFRTDLRINLSSVYDATDIEAANLIFKHQTNNESITLSFNVQGPFVNNSSIETYYNIYDLQGNSVLQNRAGYTQNGLRISDINLFGQNTINISYDANFIKEDIYLIVFNFTQGNDIIKSVNKVLITSETFNSFYNTNSDFNTELYAEDWIGRYVESWSYNDTYGEVTNVNYNNPINASSPTPKWPENYLTNTNVNLPEQINYNLTKNIPITMTVNADIDSLAGRIWQNVNYSIQLKEGETVLGNLQNGTETDLIFNFVAEALAYARIQNAGIKRYNVPDSYSINNLSPYVQTTPLFIANSLYIGGSSDFRFTNYTVDGTNYTTQFDVRSIAKSTINGSEFKQQLSYIGNKFTSGKLILGIIGYTMRDNNSGSRFGKICQCDGKRTTDSNYTVLARSNSAGSSEIQYAIVMRCKQSNPSNYTELNTPFVIISDIGSYSGSSGLQKLQTILNNFVANVRYINGQATEERIAWSVFNREAITNQVNSSFELSNLSVVTTLNSNPHYVWTAAGINIDMYNASSVATFINKLRTVESGLNQIVNTTKFTTTNFTYTRSSATFEKEFTYNLSLDETIYYNILENYDLTDINLEISQNYDKAISDTEITDRSYTKGFFLKDGVSLNYNIAPFNNAIDWSNSGTSSGVNAAARMYPVVMHTLYNQPWENSDPSTMVAIVWTASSNANGPGANDKMYIANYTTKEGSRLPE